MRRTIWTPLIVGLLLGGVEARAEEGAPAQLDAPPPPPQIESGEVLEADVTIRQEPERLVEEYRINGRVYMIRYVPKIGPSYYLVDTDGDGTLDARRFDPNMIHVPQWILFRW